MVKCLLDTMVVSEVTKLRADKRVLNWMDGQPDVDSFVSVITLGELWKGVEKLPSSRRRSELEIFATTWIEEAFAAGRIIDVDRTIARRWGALAAQLGRTLPVADGFIAATALVHGLTVATRNVRDFTALGVPVLNPWS